MADRYMLDCMHANLPATAAGSHLEGVSLMAGYVTGSPGTRWTTGDWAFIHGKGLIPVTIDQGYTGSPVPSATVRDVEAGAWPTDLAVVTRNWAAARKTIYAARSDMNTIISQGWTGDIWLACPLAAPPTKASILAQYPQYGKANLIGVQYALDAFGIYDKSVIYDPAWPAEPAAPHLPVEEDHMALTDADVNLIWGKKFLEYIDEGGEGERTARTTADILFAAHAAAVTNERTLANLTAAVAALQAQAGDVDEAALAAALTPVIEAAISAAGQADAQDIATAVAAVLAQKLGT